MFGLFKSKKQKRAKNLIDAAYKVYNYRCDAVDPADAKRLSALIERLEELVGDGKAGTAEYDRAADETEALMRKCGGAIYPLTAWADYTDMIIVAGILAIGIRSFFLQPFKIPTNSMYPSFYGMTSQVYGGAAGEEAPSLPERAWRFLMKDADNYRLRAPVEGNIYIELRAFPFKSEDNKIIFPYCNITRPTKKYFVWPTQERVYKFIVDDKEVELAVPVDFQINEIMESAFVLKKENIELRNNRYFLHLGYAKRGETFLNFDILGGDMLFVDRFTYNFKKPRIGDSIVFRTKYCEGMTKLNNDVPIDLYYIKRLVGQGGDTLTLKDSTLIRNGKPIEGSSAFEANAKKLGLYPGYCPYKDLQYDTKVEVKQGHYYAMGDNSPNSSDSRYWGQVPERALVGKSLIIFYPFTPRWGATK